MTTTEHALRYKAQLQAIDPSVEYLMTLYLSPELTPDEVRKAAAAGIVGAPPSPSHPHAAPARDADRPPPRRGRRQA